MTIVEKAVEWIKGMANDNSHGYDQAHRWGPDYDCSSLVISAYKYAGVPLTCTYTGNMLSDFLKNGFKDVKGSVNIKTGAGLIKGDVLLNQVHHTGMYIGDGYMVEAGGNEYGGVTGGKTGDQTGREIAINAYHNFGSAGWDNVLRLTEDRPVEEAAETHDDGDVRYYTVQSGDSLWSIAEKTLGSGSRYPEIQIANNLTSAFIYPGQVLIIPSAPVVADVPVVSEPEDEPAPVADSSLFARMPVLKYGDVAKSVRILQYALNMYGAKPKLDVDGEFGPKTKSALCAYQKKSNIEESGTTTASTWEKMFSE